MPAAQSNGVDITLIAAADLRTKQFFGIKVDTAGKAVLGAAGDYCIGILQNKPNTGEAATIRVLGRSKASADAAVVANAKVTTSADGQLVTGTIATDNILGVALTAAGAAAEIFEVLVNPSGIGVAD